MSAAPALRYPEKVKRRSPTIEGFRVLFRRPSVWLAEIAWRWSFGAAATLLGFVALREYLDTLPVSKGDMFLLGSGQPYFALQAIRHIFHGSAPRAAEGLIVLAIALTVGWIVLAAIGRALTTKELIAYFRELEPALAEAGPDMRFRLGPLLGLNFLRAGAALAALIGCVGGLVLGAEASPAKDPSPGSAMLIFLTTCLVVLFLWGAVNWLLSIAALFAVARGEDTFGAISAAVNLCRERLGAVLAASSWFGLAHLVALVVASSVWAFPLAFISLLPGAVVLGGVLLVSLLYFAVADFIYIGRLAAYVFLVEFPQEDVSVLANIPLIESVDQNEPILSDLPLPEAGPAY